MRYNKGLCCSTLQKSHGKAVSQISSTPVNMRLRYSEALNMNYHFM